MTAKGMAIITDKTIFEILAAAPEKDDEAFYDSNKKRIRPGDMIAFRRGGYLHPALYIKHGMVLHVTRMLSDGPVKIVLQNLEGLIQECQYFVKNLDEEALTKYKAKPLSFEKIIEAAAESIGREFDYKPFKNKNNCGKHAQHGCAYWRYGVKSLQVETAKEVATSDLLLGSLACAPSFGFRRGGSKRKREDMD